MITRILHSAAVVAVSLIATPVLAVNYTFSTIIELDPSHPTSPPLHGDFPQFAASINNSGVVTYIAERQLTGEQDLFVSSSGTALISDGAFDSIPVINDSGTVAVAFDDGVSTTGVYNATASSFIYDSTAGLLEFFGLLAINNSGTASFVADYIATGSPALSTATPQTTIADSTGPLADFLATDINNDGVVAYSAELDASSNISLFTSDSATAIDTLADIMSVAINDNNVVAYSDVNNIYADGAALLTTGGTFDAFSAVDLNNNNTMAILGSIGLDNVIYARSGPVLDRIVGTNDIILGNRFVQGVAMGPQAINDSGQIVFYAQSFNISTNRLNIGIYVATPDFLLGDINVDGNINVADNLLMTQYLLGLKTPTAAQSDAADMNQDASLTLSDLVLHSRNVLGQIY